MQPDSKRFIDLATRPLEGNSELKLAAEEKLRFAIATDAAGQANSLTIAADALAKADSQPFRRWLRIALIALTVAVSSLMVGYAILQVREVVLLRYLFGGFIELPTPKLEILNLTAAQRLLLFGNKSSTTEAGKWKPLWDSAPENPIYFMEYAHAYFRDHKKFSPEILATAERLDPENGWLPALATSVVTEGAVTKKKSRSPSKAKSKSSPASVWHIEDRQRLDDSLAMIHELVKKPRFDSYKANLMRQRIPLLPPRTDFISQISRMTYVFSQDAVVFKFLKLADVLAAGAQECAATGDVEGYHQIVHDWKILSESMTQICNNLLEVLVTKSFMHLPLKNFRDAAKTLGLDKEAAEFAALDELFEKQKKDRELRSQAQDGDNLITKHGTIFVSLGIPQIAKYVATPPLLTKRDLMPSRYAYHAFCERLMTWAGSIFLLVCLLFTIIFQFRYSKLTRKLSMRFRHLLQPSDWAWLIAGGVVFPGVWYFAITRLTPLAAREWVPNTVHFGPAFGFMILSMVLVPIVIARWRLGKRGAIFGLRSRGAWIGGLAGIAALTGIPVSGGIMLPDGIGKILLYASYGVFGIAAIWVVKRIIFNVLGDEPHILRHATLARIVWPVWLLGMCALTASVPYHSAQERFWIQQDRILELSLETPTCSRYEHQVAQILRSELLDVLNP